MKSEKWDGMYVDLLAGDEVAGGSVIRAQIEQPEPMRMVSPSIVCSVYVVFRL